MGELILCSRPIAARPYFVDELSLNIYSLEELSYYIFHNVYLLGSDFMDLELINWIDKELGLGELAVELRRMISENAPLHVFVLKLLNASGYLSVGEIKDTMEIISVFENKSDAERRKVRADRLLEKQRILEAIYEYEDLLINTEDAGERLLGDIWHNLGCAYAKLFFFDEAVECFKKAYRNNRRRQSLRSMLFAIRCSRNEEAYAEAVEYYGISQMEADTIKDEVQRISQSNEILRFSEEMDRLKGSYSRHNAFVGQVSDIVNRWKDEYMTLCHI